MIDFAKLTVGLGIYYISVGFLFWMADHISIRYFGELASEYSKLFIFVIFTVIFILAVLFLCNIGILT